MTVDLAGKPMGYDEHGVIDKKINDLLEASNNLPSASSELGSIQLSVSELKRRITQLSDKKQEGKDYTKARYLLANNGLNFDDVDYFIKDLKSGQLMNELSNNTDGTRTNKAGTTIIAGSKRAEDGNLDMYLRAKKDENILISIEQLLNKATRDFDTFVNQNLNLDWNNHKDEVMKNFGILVHGKSKQDSKKNLEFNSLVNPIKENQISWGNKGTTILNSTGPKLDINENNLVREEFENYARVVFQFNNARQDGQDFPLSKEIISILNNSTFSDQNPRNLQLLEAWKILDSMSNANVINNNDNDNNSNNNNNSLSQISQQFLEKQFREYVDNLYKKNMDEGLATPINKIKSFIDSKLKNSDNTWKIANLTIVNGVPIWAELFYLLRAGLATEALKVLMNNKSSFKKIEQSFFTYFGAYVSSKDHKLPAEYAAKLPAEYNQHIKSALNGDPYRLAVYKLIGRCDLNRKTIPAVTLSIEDWLWMHLMLVREDTMNNDPIFERYTLEDFQNIIISYGPSRFSNYYLQVLVLSGLYEMAIDYTYLFGEMNAVHLAIGFAKQNLLKSHDTETSENKITKRDTKFTSILANYANSFKYSDPRVAVEYIVLMTLNNENNKETEICYEALRELVLDTREFTILLGKVGRDGIKIPGVIEERQSLLKLDNEKQFLHTITEQAARRADEDGRVYDSILLYQLSEEYDVVISLVNELLSDLLSNSDPEEPLWNIDDNSETNPILVARSMVSIYVDNAEISKHIRIKNKEVCLLLLSITEIRSLYLERQWQATLSQIELLDLFPFEDELSARKKAQEFSSLEDTVVKNIPNLLIITLKCVSHLVSDLNKSAYQVPVKTQQINSLKAVARNCMIYAGIIQYRMPRETYSTLIQLDVSL